MLIRYEQYWLHKRASQPLSKAVVVSLVLHALIIGGICGLAIYQQRMAFLLPPAYNMRFVPYPKGDIKGDENVKPTPKAKTEEKAPEPKPAEPPKPVEPPKPPEPPKPVEPPKVEPPKAVETPKPPDIAKPDKAVKPKEPAKPAAKTPVPKTPAKTAAKTPAKKPPGKPQEVPAALDDPTAWGRADGSEVDWGPGMFKAGINMPEGVPSGLESWARTVQIKVEKIWTPPPPVAGNIENNRAIVSFLVDRQGNIIGEPEVKKEASDPEVGKSGIKAIKEAQPLPPFPDTFDKELQEVFYVFTVT